MTFGELVRRTASWLDGTGRHPSVVVSSRVRLARNLSGIPFTNRSSEAEQRAVIEAVALILRDRLTYFETSDLSGLERQLLVERHLISPVLSQSGGAHGVLVDDGELISVMLNEEDHLRLQAIFPGFQPREAWNAARGLDGELRKQLSVAHSPRWGYLTACATNTGTGLRASVLIHLPGLVLTREMERVVRGVAQMGFVVRGLYGEGTESSGNLYQISNQLTMGRGEAVLLGDLEKVIGELIGCETNARETLVREARGQIEDKVWRAYGILGHARLLTSQELMNFSSVLRLGVDLGMIDTVSLAALNQMMVETKPSHLQFKAGSELAPEDRDRRRADQVRARISSTDA